MGEKLKFKIRPLNIKRPYRIYLFRSVYILSIVTFILECRTLGFMPIFNMFGDEDIYHLMVENAMPLLHYFVQISSVALIWSLILHKNKFISVKERNIVVVICTLIQLNTLSRQMWVLTIISLLSYFIFFRKINKKELITIVISAVVLFVFIGAVRFFYISNELKGSVALIKDYSGIDYDVNIIEAYLGLYSTNNFTTFQEFVNDSNKYHYRGLGVYTLRPVFTLFGLNYFDEFDINPKFDSMSALGTYAIEPYLDFGVIGIIIINLIYGIFTSYVYSQYIKGRVRWIIPWGLMLFCVLMSAFTNYYNTFFIWLVMSLNFIVLPPQEDIVDRENIGK